MTSVTLRPRSATEIVDAMFQLLREYYPQLAAAVLVADAPGLMAHLLLPQPYLPLARVLTGIGTTIAGGAVVAIAGAGYLGRDLETSRALELGVRRVWRLLGAGFVQALFMLFGLILLVVPAFIFAAWTFAMGNAIMLEDKGVDEAFSRSRELARGHVWHVIKVGVTTLVVIVVLAVTLGGALAGGMGALGLSERLQEFGGAVAEALVLPAVGVATTLLYYDLRIRKEGFDIEVMAGELGGRLPVSPARAAV